MEKKTKRDWAILTFFGIAMIVMVVLLALFGKSPPKDEEIQEYFENYVQEHGELGTGTAVSAGIPSAPKLFMMSATKIVDENGNEAISYTKEIDVTGIPKELRARYLDELNAVALVRSEIYETYYYTDGHKGYVMKYYVSMIDLATNSILAEDFFFSGRPNAAKSKYEGDQYGGFPYTNIHDWVKDYFLKNAGLSTK